MIQVLLQYQEVDKKLRKIEQELYNSDERKRAAAAKNFLMDSEDTAKKIERRAEDLLTVYRKTKESFDKRSAMAEEYANTAESLTSSDEVSYLARKVSELLEQVRVLEREITSITKDIEEVVRLFAEFRAKYNTALKEYGDNKEKYDELKKSKAEIVNQIKQKLTEIASGIGDKSVIERYNKRRSDKIFPVLVPLREDKCGGCSMQLPLGEIEKLKKAKIIECEHCRRIIYVDD